MPLKKQKIYVLDTNVMLHDSSCLYQFDEHDIVVPIIVLEELDRFKKGKEVINYHARDFFRALDSLTGDNFFNGGVSIGPDNGKISIALEKEFHNKLKDNFAKEKADHRILNTAFHIANDNPSKTVILVSKDVSLRMKAKSIGVQAEDYTTDHVENISELYTGQRTLEDIPDNIIDTLFKAPYEINVSELTLTDDLINNEYLVLRNNRKSALGVYKSKDNLIKRVEPNTCFGIKPRNAEQSFALNALMDQDMPLVSITGKAGTGKTLLALAASLERKKHYRQIFIARPSVPLSNKDIGFLPGDIKSKLDPYMQPLYDNLSVIQDQFSSENTRSKQIKELLDTEKIAITPLSYIRGRSIVKVFFIVDEAQNLSPHEIKTIITRAGEDTKIVFTGDIFQIDHPYLDEKSNGLSYLIEKMKGQELYTHINLEKGERSELSELASSLL